MGSSPPKVALPTPSSTPSACPPLSQNWLGDPDLAALWAVLGVLVWMQLGYPFVLFMSGLLRIDPELYEAAALYGALLVAASFTPSTVLYPAARGLRGSWSPPPSPAWKVFAQISSSPLGGGPGNSTPFPSYSPTRTLRTAPTSATDPRSPARSPRSY
ncbi:hypothetical protein LV779_15885 [Streptomyces thinghirensis]|nr:hypothetical protein [Streptomyces thinghirensis]